MIQLKDTDTYRAGVYIYQPINANKLNYSGLKIAILLLLFASQRGSEPAAAAAIDLD